MLLTSEFSASCLALINVVPRIRSNNTEMDDPTISEGFEAVKFLELIKHHTEEGDDVDSIAKEEKFNEFKKSIQDGRLKSASSPSYFIMTINMNSPKKRVTEKRRRFVSIIMRSFFSSIIFCQELPGYFEEKVVAECGASEPYGHAKNGKESAVIWLKEDFDGETEGLETTDTWIREVRNSLGADASELLSRIAMVKLTSKEPSADSVLAVSWHGRHKLKYEDKLREFESLTTFLAKVIKKKGIPSYIIGGDFNFDTLEVELPKDGVVSNYELSPRQTQVQQGSGCYIPHKDNFILFPNKKLRVSNVRPFLFEDKETTTTDFSKDDQANVTGEMANATNTSVNPTDMLDHDPIIGVIQFTSSTAVKNLSKEFEKVAIADS